MTSPVERPQVKGTSPRRKEDRRLVTGHGNFVGDIELPGMLHVSFARSPVGHATLKGVDVEAARLEPGVVDVATSFDADFDGVVLRAASALESYVETAQPALAAGKVRYTGEPVAAVVSDNRYRAEVAVELVGMDYEDLPVMVRLNQTPEAPVHDEAPDNVLLSRTFAAGDIDDALAGAHLVTTRSLDTNRHAGNPIECRAGVALWDSGSQEMTFWSGTQVPHVVRNVLATLLGLQESKLRVVAPDVGGGFGVKAVLYPEDITLCLLAKRHPGVAIKWVEDRAEHLQTATHAREHHYEVSAGFDIDGHLLGVKATIDCNVGAYSVYPWTAGIEALMAGGLLTGPYKVANYGCSVRGVTTNTAPAGPYRGVARPATVFAMEALLDDAAVELGIDPFELRRRNLIAPDDVPYRLPTRLVDDSGQYLACLDKALHAVDLDAFRAEQQRRREADENPIGIGVACYNELTGLGRKAAAGPRMPFRTGHDACSVRVNTDGSVLVQSGVTSQGQGIQTTIAQIVADAVGVPYDSVDVHFGDTTESLWGSGAFSSRQAVIAGGAAHRAGEAVREQAVILAAQLVGAAQDEVELHDGQFYVSGKEEPVISLAEVARVAYMETNRLPDGIEPGLDATEFYDPVKGAFAAGAQIGVVEVEKSTGRVTILQWVCVEDAGNVLHPQVVDGQIKGAIAQGIGGALYEHHIYDDQGNLQTGTLLDYLLPTSMEIPDMTVEHMSHPADNPLGVRGVGEGGTLGPNAVIAAGVRDAVGVRIDSLPISPTMVWTALQETSR